MLRRLVAALVAGLVLGLPSAAAAQEGGGQTDAAPSLPAQSWVLADADTGQVLAAHNHHEPRYVASLMKVLTAFVALEHLPPDTSVTVSELAGAQPAMRIGMQGGQVWEFDHALHSLLMVSANDAAYALAEATAGSLEEFASLMQRTAERLGTQDSTFLDPAGFDGEEGFGGGSRVSAYDMAVIARNAIAVPEIATIAAKPTFEFFGGDERPHTLTNHNKLLHRYEGATGLKTGYTRAAGHSLVATAQRGERTLIAVVLASTDIYGTASALLDQGFTAGAAGTGETVGTGEVLPATAFSRAQAPETETPAAEPIAASSSGGLWSAVRTPFMVLFGFLVVLVALRRRAVIRQRRRRLARRRAYLDAKRRGMIEVVDAQRYYGRSGRVSVVQPHEGAVTVLAGADPGHAAAPDAETWGPEAGYDPEADLWPPREVVHHESPRRATPRTRHHPRRRQPTRRR